MATTTSDKIGSRELCEATGLSYRQLDYWVRNNVIASHGPTGSGNPRTFDASIIPAIKALVKVAHAFSTKDVGQLATGTYCDILDNYELGWIEVAPGVRIHWDEDDE